MDSDSALRARRSQAAILLFGLTTACAGRAAAPPVAPAPSGCADGQQAMVRDALYFGLAIPAGGTVPDSLWDQFLSTVITPAFPAGLTVMKAAGQWRGDSGGIVSEPSRIVVLLHPSGPAADSAIASITDAYRTRFRQESVLQERQPVCVHF